MDRFLRWLFSLQEAEKSLAQRPVGLSRRSFLKALGIGVVTVSCGGVLLGSIEDVEPDEPWGDLIEQTIHELGRLRYQDIAADLQHHRATYDLFKSQFLASR